MKINLVRIDDRLIHGQVATVWSKEANAQRIIICSDEVAKDQIRKTFTFTGGTSRSKSKRCRRSKSSSCLQQSKI
jgi:pts-sorbose: PTS system, mannose/fructose/sorbose family, IIB component